MTAKRPLILIVDDAPEDIAIYKRHLTRGCDRRYRIQEAATGASALAMCRRRAPDCVLLDFRLPDLNGLEVLRALALPSGVLPCAVVMLAEIGDTQIAVNAMKYGAQDFLEKSWITPELLDRAIANAIEKAALQREVEEQRRELAIKNLMLEQRLADLQREVNERRQAEDALKLANERFTIAEAASKSYVYDWDLESGRIERSAGFSAMLGYNDGEATETHDWCLQQIHPDDVERATEMLDQIARSRKADEMDGYSMEYRIRHKDGRYLWRWVQGKLMRDDAGRVTRVIGCAVDVTRRKQIENSLRESESRLKLAISAMNGGSWEWDLITNEVRWSDEMYGLFDRRPSDFTPTVEGWLGSLSAEDRARAEEAIEAVRRGEDAWMEYHTTWPDGAARWLELRGVTLRDEQGRPVRLVGITTDITKRKLAEEALRESEEKFSKVFKASPHRITITTLDEGRYIDVNDAVLRATGYERSEMIGHTAEEIQIFAEPEGREKLLRAFHDRSVRDLELQLRSKNGEVMTVLMSAEIITLNGRQCIVTLSNDITARVRAEEALRESEERFRTLANTVPSIIWMAAPDGTITFHNQQWFDYCGVSPGQNGDWMQLVIHPDDLERCFAEWTSAGELGCEFETELRLRRRDGQYRWFLVRATPVRDAESRVAKWFGVVTDIDDREQAEEARRESDERLKLAMEASGMSVWETDLASGHIIWLEFGEQMMGVKPGSFGGTYESFLSLVHPDDRESVLEARNRALRGEAPYELEFRTMRDDGGVRWGLVRGVVHRDEQGAPTRIVGVNVDITERKQMEDALRLSEERYRLLVRTSSNVVIITDVNGGNPDSGSDWWEQLTGQAWDETRNRGWMKCVHPDDYDETAATWRNAIAKQEPFETEFRVRARDGDYCWLHFTGAPIRDARQRFREWAIALRDITKRKQAEEQLREKEKFIQSLVDAVPLGIYIFDLREMRTVFSNPQLASLLGHAMGEIEAMGSEILPLIIHPEDQEIVYEHLERQRIAPDGSVLEVECRVKHRSGEWRWFASRDLVFMRDADGRPRRILGVTQDITERRRAEVTLRENAERLRLAMEAANAGSFDWDIASGVIVWTPNRLGSPGSLSPLMEANDIEEDYQSWRARVHPEDIDWVEADIAKTLAERRDLYIEYRVLRSEGAIRWLSNIGHTLYNEAGQPTRMHGLTIDVTERKRAEERLRESEERLRLALQGAQAGVWEVKFDPFRAHWSKEYRELYGFSETDQETNELWATRIHPDDLRRVVEGNNALLGSDHNEMRQEFRILHPERGERWLLDFVRVHRDPSGRPISLGGINLDVTERKRAEEALRESEEQARRQNAELENIYQATPIGLSLVDRDFRFMRINQTLAEINGVPVDQSLGRTVREVILGLADHLEPVFKRVIRTGRPIMNLEIHGATPREPGIERDWLASYYPIKGANGSVQGIGAVVLDITDRKRAEAVVRESEERLRLAAQAAGFGLYSVDLRTGENYWSPEMRQVFGLSGDDAVRMDKLIEFIHPDDREETMRVAEASLDPRGNGEFEIEYRALRPDGDVRWALARGKALFTGKGRRRKAARVIGVAFDITERKEAEKRLHASEESFRTIFDLSGIGILQIEPSTGCFLRANREFCNWLGYSEAELLKMKLEDVAHPDDREEKWTAVGRFLRGEVDEYITETRCVRKDGRVVWGLITSRMLRDAGGGPLRTVTAVQDITGRKQFEEALMASEGRYRNLIETANEGIWLVDAEASTLYVNERMANLLGYGADEITGRKVPEFCFDQDIPKIVEQISDNLRGGYKEFDFKFRRKDGDELQVLASTSPVSDMQGVIVGAMGMFTDITERKRAEEALRESERRLKLSLTAGRAGTWEWRIKDDKLIWSDEYYDLYGRKPGDLEPTLENFLLCVHPEDRDRLLAERAEVLRERKDAEHEFRFVRPDGCVRWAQSKAQLTLDELGEPERLVGITIDITTRVQAGMEREELLRKEREARAQAEEANRGKDEFVAMISHELRSPLNAMLGWSKILRKGGVDAKTQAHAVEVIERSARAQQNLIEDLLDMARIVGGKLRLETRPVSLARVVEAAADVVGPAAAAREIDLRMAIESADEVTGDPDRLQQVVWNLLSNAVKFTTHGGSVEVTLERVGPSAQITVTDTGRGIKAEDLPFIFDRFRQADSSSTRRFAGLGLGLALVKHLVELHGGQVSADSLGEGQGASFIVRLPVRAVRGEAAPARAEDYDGLRMEERDGRVTEREVWGAYPPSPLDGVWALIVDDESDARELVATLLRQYGARVTVASSAAEAFDKLRKGEAGARHDVLVSDISMPDEDGYMLIERVRKLPPEEGGKIPAIALTAYERPSDRIKALASGFSMHVPKPVEPEELAMVIANLTGHPGVRMNVR